MRTGITNKNSSSQELKGESKLRTGGGRVRAMMGSDAAPLTP